MELPFPQKDCSLPLPWTHDGSALQEWLKVEKVHVCVKTCGALLSWVNHILPLKNNYLFNPRYKTKGYSIRLVRAHGYHLVTNTLEWFSKYCDILKSACKTKYLTQTKSQNLWRDSDGQGCLWGPLVVVLSILIKFLDLLFFTSNLSGR